MVVFQQVFLPVLPRVLRVTQCAKPGMPFAALGRVFAFLFSSLFHGLSHSFVLQLTGLQCPRFNADSYASLPFPGEG